MKLELDYLEANQVVAALLDRLEKANAALPVMTEGTPEIYMVEHEIRYTGSVLVRLQEALYGTDEPDQPVWDLLAERAAHDGHETPETGCALCSIDMDASYRSVVGWAP
jgi:hypothetical protein